MQRIIMPILRTGMFLLVLFSVITCKKSTSTNNGTPSASYSYTSNGASSVTFTSTSTNSPTSFQWNFGDGTTGTGNPVTHVYKMDSGFAVKLTVSNSEGSSSTTDTFQKLANIHTRFGDMLMWLDNQTPLYKRNYLGLADTGFYDSTTFHRIVQNFVIQGGDPLSKNPNNPNVGTGGPGYTIPFLYVQQLTHVYGAVGAASTGAGQPGNGSQFYIVVNPQGEHTLDGSYPIFGLIINGMNVAVNISNQPQNSANNMPLSRITMAVKTVIISNADLKGKYGFTPY